MRERERKARSEYHQVQKGGETTKLIFDICDIWITFLLQQIKICWMSNLWHFFCGLHCLNPVSTWLCILAFPIMLNIQLTKTISLDYFCKKSNLLSWRRYKPIRNVTKHRGCFQIIYELWVLKILLTGAESNNQSKYAFPTNGCLIEFINLKLIIYLKWAVIIIAYLVII